MRCSCFSFEQWSKLFGKHLLLANTLSSSLFMVTGGAIVQGIEILSGTRNEWNLVQLGRLSAVGGVIGIQQHYLYLYADHRWLGNGTLPIIKKLTFDHIIITHITLVTFFCGLNILEGVSSESLLDEFIEKYWMTYPVDVGISLPTQFYNFYYLPPKYRVIFVAAVSTLTAVAFTIIKELDYKHHDHSKKQNDMGK